MRSHPTSLASLKRLVENWRLFGLMALQMMRLVLRCERGDPQRALVRADALEQWVRPALILLAKDIAEHSADVCADGDPEDDLPLKQLKSIYIGLLGLALFVAEVKARLQARLSGVPYALKRALCAQFANDFMTSISARAPEICDSS